MAVAGERRASCDGCGKTVAVEELSIVSMPDGDKVVCCDRCEPYARDAAEKSAALDQRRDTCDGCAGEFVTSELEELVLEHGTVVTCCPSCAADAPGEDGGDAGETETETDASDEDATDLCGQCNEWVSEELYRVTTVDGRTDRLCSDCKADAERRGVVSSVAMRASRAREVLGVDADVSDEELRTAYLRNVKRAHPDRESGSQSAFTLVTEAYDRLQEYRSDDDPPA